METLVQDVRYGFRMLRKSPGFTAVAVITLALGIGANTAIYSVIDAVLLHPLPYRDAKQLVVVWEQNPERGWFRNVVSGANFLDWKKQNHVFTEMAAIKESSFNLSGSGRPEEILGEQVSANFFSVLGVQPVRGRTFLPEEDTPGRSRVAVLSDGLWKRAYGADRQLVGRQISLNGEQFTVIGIAPPGFYFPAWDWKAQVWIAGLDLSLRDRAWHNFRCLARLKPGVSLAQAQAEMDAIAARIQLQFPAGKGWGVEAVSLHEQVAGDTRPVLLVLLATVGVVLLIACANLANLQLARATAREREIAVRAALGADRRRLARQLLTESVLLSLLGGACGVLLAGLGIQSLVALAPQATPGLEFVHLNLQVLLFALIASLLTGVVFGLPPAVGASRSALWEPLKDAARGSVGVRGQRFRRLLVTSELALAVLLLVTAGLLVRSFIFLSQVNPGFDPHNILTVSLPLLDQRYSEPRQQIAFFHQLLQNVGGLPGVISAAALDEGGLPPNGGNAMGFLIEGRPAPRPNERPDAIHRLTSPDYFRLMGIALLRGRTFTEDDADGAPPVAIIDEKLAHEYWPGRDPLGQRVQFPGLDSKQPRWFTIVGVVASVKSSGLEVAPYPTIYVSYRQQPAYFDPRVLLVRTSRDPMLSLAAIRHEVERLDKSQPVSDVMTMDQLVDEARAGRRFPMILLGLFAALALVLAAVGTYGVLSYAVAQRTQELGIRMALGARPFDVLRLVLGQGMAVTLGGVVVGLVGAAAATRLLTRLLYGVRPLDAVTFALAPVCLSIVALLASYIPARRASRVDPMVALRYQ